MREALKISRSKTYFPTFLLIFPNDIEFSDIFRLSLRKDTLEKPEKNIK